MAEEYAIKETTWWAAIEKKARRRDEEDRQATYERDNMRWNRGNNIIHPTNLPLYKGPDKDMGYVKQIEIGVTIPFLLIMIKWILWILCGSTLCII